MFLGWRPGGRPYRAVCAASPPQKKCQSAGTTFSESFRIGSSRTLIPKHYGPAFYLGQSHYGTGDIFHWICWLWERKDIFFLKRTFFWGGTRDPTRIWYTRDPTRIWYTRDPTRIWNGVGIKHGACTVFKNKNDNQNEYVHTNLDNLDNLTTCCTLRRDPVFVYLRNGKPLTNKAPPPDEI